MRFLLPAALDYPRRVILETRLRRRPTGAAATILLAVAASWGPRPAAAQDDSAPAPPPTPSGMTTTDPSSERPLTNPAPERSSPPSPSPAAPAPLPTSVGRPRIAAARARTPPAVDGALNDAVWASATPSDAFVQKFPDEGGSPVERTLVRVLYGDDALYVAVECEQRSAPLRARLTRRDREIESDYVRVAIDSRSTGTSAFEFGVNAAGVLYDSLRYNDTEISADWDEAWEARTARTARGWTAELRIPYRILRFDAAPDMAWGFQVRRYVSARQETDEWAFIPRAVGGEVSHYGRLTGLRDVPSRVELALRPFALAQIRKRDIDPAIADSGVDGSASAGLDLAWNITEDLTLDATVNPDFAQVEADQRVLNLTNYEVLFPELRPFFLSGIDAYSTPIQVLYTRRIGLAPPWPAVRTDAPYGERLADVPGPTTIPFAAKLAGTLGPYWSMSALTATTAPNSVEIAPATGPRELRLTEPSALYGFLRVKRELGDNAHVALLGTAALRGEPGHVPELLSGSAAYPSVPGEAGAPPSQLCPDGSVTEVGARCFRNAFVGGVDGRWRSRGGDYTVKGQAIATAVTAGPEQRLRDGTVIASGDVAPGALLDLIKDGGEHWVGELYGDIYAPKVALNDLGYLQRQNLQRLGVNIEYRTLKPWWATLETHTSLFGSYKNNFDGLALARTVQVETSWKLRGYWSVLANVALMGAYFDDREVGDGTALERATAIETVQTISTDPRAPVAGKLTSTLQFRGNGRNVGFDGELNLRPVSQLELDLLSSVFLTDGEPRYAGSGPGPDDLLFGRLSARSVSGTVRSTFTFTPRITLQAYGQLFLASAHFSDFSASSATRGDGAPRVVTLESLQPAAPPATNPDVEEVALNVSVVFRWEYALGSTLYVVYTRAQAPLVELAEGAIATLRPSLLGAAPAVDVGLVKLSYFLPL